MKHTNCQTCKYENPVGFGLDFRKEKSLKRLQKLWYKKGQKCGLDFVLCGYPIVEKPGKQSTKVVIHTPI